MAAKTPDSIFQEKLGTVRLILARFSTTNIDDTDTYSTGMTGIVDAFFTPDTTTGVVGCSVAASTGVITFAASAPNQTGTLHILVRG